MPVSLRLIGSALGWQPLSGWAEPKRMSSPTFARLKLNFLSIEAYTLAFVWVRLTPFADLIAKLAQSLPIDAPTYQDRVFFFYLQWKGSVDIARRNSWLDKQRSVVQPLILVQKQFWNCFTVAWYWSAICGIVLAIIAYWIRLAWIG